MSSPVRRALSIRQPWAWLIVNGHKDIENRDWKPWNPGLRFRGPVLIHAGKSCTYDDWMDAFSTAQGILSNNILQRMPSSETFRTTLCGGLVGEAEIVDAVTESDSPWFFGRYGLALRNARPLPFRPCKGMLGFFTPEAPLAEPAIAQGTLL